MLKLGTNNIGKIYLGSTKIAKAYLGNTLVYESGSTPPTPHDYSQDYLTFEALESGTFTLRISSAVSSSHVTSVSYSVDNGTNWVTTNNTSSVVTITTPTIAVGSKVLWKGIAARYSTRSGSDCSSIFSSTGRYNVSGNIMSLLYGDNFINNNTFPSFSNSQPTPFYELFKSSKVVSGENLILPATTLIRYCYASMFQSCTSLTTAPVLPAITLANYCYNQMFSGCSSLNYVKALFTSTPGTGFTFYWLQNVSSTGIFVKNSAATWDVRSGSGIPEGWTVQTATE